MATMGKLPNTTNHLAPVAALTAADETHTINATFSNTEVAGALDDLGTAVNAIITILEQYGMVRVN